jgi:hypothetical protein
MGNKTRFLSVVWKGLYRTMEVSEPGRMVGNIPGYFRQGKIGNTPVLAHFSTPDALGTVVAFLPENGFFFLE